MGKSTLLGFRSDVDIPGERVEVGNQTREISVFGAGFMAQLMLKRDGERENQVDSSPAGLVRKLRFGLGGRHATQFGQKVLLSKLSFTFLGMYPYGASEIAAMEIQSAPVLPTFVVPCQGTAVASVDQEAD